MELLVVLLSLCIGISLADHEPDHHDRGQRSLQEDHKAEIRKVYLGPFSEEQIDELQEMLAEHSMLLERKELEHELEEQIEKELERELEEELEKEVLAELQRELEKEDGEITARHPRSIEKELRRQLDEELEKQVLAELHKELDKKDVFNARHPRSIEKELERQLDEELEKQVLAELHKELDKKDVLNARHPRSIEKELERQLDEELEKQVLAELHKELDKKDVVNTRLARSTDTSVRHPVTLQQYLLHTQDDGEIRARVAQLFKFEEEMRRRLKKEQEKKKLDQSLTSGLLNGYVAFMGKIFPVMAKAIVNSRTEPKPEPKPEPKLLAKPKKNSIDESLARPKPRYRRRSEYFGGDEEEEQDSVIKGVMDDIEKRDGLLRAIYETRMDPYEASDMDDRADVDTRYSYSWSPEGSARAPHFSDVRTRASSSPEETAR